MTHLTLLPPALRPLALSAALLSAALLASTPAAADCRAGSLSAWPRADAGLPLQPMILLESYGDRQPQVAALATGGVAHLVGGGQRVALVVEAIHVGAFEVTQAVLGVKAPLKPATRYALELRGADSKPVPPPGPGDKPIGWRTVAAEQPGPLALNGPVEITGQSYAAFGCGPASYIVARVPAESSAPIFAEVTLRPLSGQDAPRTYVLPVLDGALTIGHGMCSGPFRVTGPERRWQAALTIRDAAGRRVVVPERIELAGVDPKAPE